jgi:hypothetical protein
VAPLVDDPDALRSAFVGVTLADARTVAEARLIPGASEASLRRLARTRLPHGVVVRLGRKVLFNVPELARWCASGGAALDELSARRLREAAARAGKLGAAARSARRTARLTRGSIKHRPTI